ncbi:MAG: DUF4920 domain-containing protein [Archangium sp.]
MNSLRSAMVVAVMALSACGVEKLPEQLPTNPDPVTPTNPNPMETEESNELPALPTTAPELFATNYKRQAGIDYVDFDELVANPQTYVNRTIETRGIVRASCQVRGCWMEVRSVRDAKSKSMTVRFVNYSFFVPLDSRSADVRFQGTVKVETLTAAQVAEYESEGYAFGAKNADGSVTQVGFTANGVEMWRKN